MIRVDASRDATVADAIVDALVDSHTPDASLPDATESCAADADCPECAPCDLDRGLCIPLTEARLCAGGAGTCQDGVCLRHSCVVDGACDDGDSCNGVERCGPSGCQHGEPPSCNDGDVCTADSCRGFLGGCVHIALDHDGDGHGPLFPGPCGDDCNDADPRVFPGQTVYQSSPIDDVSSERDFDYDCDGVERPIFDEGVGFCELVGSNCFAHMGFLDAVPSCGESGFMLGRCREVTLPSGVPGCVELPDSSLRIQRCL